MSDNEMRSEMSAQNEEQRGEGGGNARPRNRRGRGGRNRGAKKHPSDVQNAVGAAEAAESKAMSSDAAETYAEAATADHAGQGEGGRENRRPRSRGRRGGRNRRQNTADAQTTADAVMTEEAAEDAEFMTDDPQEIMYTPTERDEIAAEVHEVITEERLEALADAAVPKTAEETQTADTEGAAKTPVEIVGVRFKAAGKVYYFDPDHALYRENDEVIVETARGIEFGFVVTANRTVMASDIVSPLKKILRMANEEDRAHYEENNRRREEAFLICREKIQEHGIEMKLIDVEYTFDNNKLLFYFTADGRVDFRELVKDLASVFRTRIELRQIGIRDEAKLMGGLGVCGRPFCCHSFLSDFVQVSIKMAKEQNLSLNSAKISGTCGRLMCCLRYEYDVYEEEIRKTPKMDAVVETPDGEAVVCEVIPLAGLVRVKYFGNHADMPPKLFHRDDVRVKGKMNWKSGTVTYLDEQK